MAVVFHGQLRLTFPKVKAWTVCLKQEKYADCINRNAVLIMVSGFKLCIYQWIPPEPLPFSQTAVRVQKSGRNNRISGKKRDTNTDEDEDKVPPSYTQLYV